MPRTLQQISATASKPIIGIGCDAFLNGSVTTGYANLSLSLRHKLFVGYKVSQAGILFQNGNKSTLKHYNFISLRGSGRKRHYAKVYLSKQSEPLTHGITWLYSPAGGTSQHYNMTGYSSNKEKHLSSNTNCWHRQFY